MRSAGPSLVGYSELPYSRNEGGGEALKLGFDQKKKTPPPADSRPGSPGWEKPNILSPSLSMITSVNVDPLWRARWFSILNLYAPPAPEGPIYLFCLRPSTCHRPRGGGKDPPSLPPLFFLSFSDPDSSPYMRTYIYDAHRDLSWEAVNIVGRFSLKMPKPRHPSLLADRKPRAACGLDYNPAAWGRGL